ncbi:hypothetical protein B0H14DRAFT_2751247, partial [Mycena olivaceomarginata]
MSISRTTWTLSGRSLLFWRARSSDNDDSGRHTDCIPCPLEDLVSLTRLLNSTGSACTYNLPMMAVGGTTTVEW